MHLLAKVDFHEPALWAVVIGWIICVTFHEFAHGLAGHLGGDYTIRERGGLTLNPLQYIDPLMSIVLPIIFLLMGGIPLPGGSTYIRRDLLRSKAWDSIVSAAGPFMNLILFALLAIPLLPQVGWININIDPQDWTTTQKFVSALCFLQLLSVFLNLVPVPPLDGFGIIAPWLPPHVREKLSTPPTSSLLFIGYFMVLYNAKGFLNGIISIMHQIMGDELFVRTVSGYYATFYK